VVASTGKEIPTNGIIRRIRMVQKIRFGRNDYLLINEGAIATEEQYRNGEDSFAHLYPDGRIWRYGEVIGTKDEIEFGEFVDIQPTAEGVARLFTRLLGSSPEELE